jgi:fermentation-respiration switch protein FrsA (DUF1100 family)
MSIFLKLLFVVVVCWLGLRWFERSNIYFPDRQLVATPAQVGMPFEDIWLTTSDGVRLNGWFIPAGEGESSPGRHSGESRNPALDPGFRRGDVTGPIGITLMLCHGNAGNISHRLDKIARLRSLGVNVFIFDYRGYGKSRGRPSEEGTYRDAEAAYRWLVERRTRNVERDGSMNSRSTSNVPRSTFHVPRSTFNGIVLYGESLGCAVAVEMARRHPEAAGVILESAFTSTVDMAKRVFPWLPARWIIRYRYDNLSKMPLIKMPVLILHSPQDEIVPFDMAQKLFAAVPGSKTFVELLGDHNEGYLDSGPRYLEAIGTFCHSLGGK